MSKGVSITYGDIALEAKENFNIDISEKKFDTIKNLQKYNMQLYNYANPCEMYQTVLDGTAVALPSNPETANIGLWSEQLSNDDGTFTTPITVTLESEGQYSSQGFTFTFDKFNDIYPTRLTIQCFRVTSEGIEDLSGETEFNPTSAFYFCRNQVENFNKVIIKFYTLNMPKSRLKLEVIDYGYETIFYGNELRSVKILQSVDPISSEIKIDTCDFTVDSKSDIEYSFQSNQTATIRFNEKLLATTFVKSANRLSRHVWEVSTEDYIGIMDSVPYVGGMYTEVKSGLILKDIFTVAKVPYAIDEEIYNIKLSGYIPYTTCREALMQVCFACCAAVTTAYSKMVKVLKLSNDITQKIPLNRIMQGQNFEHRETVTSVELASHHYHIIAPTLEAYKADESGTGKNILVKFSEPLFNLEITNGSFVENEQGNPKIGDNYAYIDADDGCILRGQKYEHTQRIYTRQNPLVLATEKENVTTITKATLVSASNAVEVLDNVYSELIKTDTTNMKIVVGSDIAREARAIKWGEKKWGCFKWGEKIVNEQSVAHQDVIPGECVTTATEYLGDITGRVTKQSYNLNGNIIVKEVTIV